MSQQSKFAAGYVWRQERASYLRSFGTRPVGGPALCPNYRRNILMSTVASLVKTTRIRTIRSAYLLFGQR